jgi:hypothetical protein
MMIDLARAQLSYERLLELAGQLPASEGVNFSWLPGDYSTTEIVIVLEISSRTKTPATPTHR